jgi:serine/threonine protein kinase
MDAILKYMPDKTVNNLIQSCRAMHTRFHAPGVPYMRKPQERFPTLWDGAKIGKGGCGTVFRVEDKEKDGQAVAVKVVEKPSIYCWFVWKRMLGEIAIMRGNKHPNVAGLIEEFQTPDRLILSLEIGGGGSLRHGYDLIKRKGFNMEIFIAHVVRQVALGLEYLYREKRVVHRDIKAENIVLSRNYNRVMIIDFGLAEVIDHNITQSFVPCGTMGYASPENIAAVVERKKVFQASGDTMHAADIFS